MKELGDIIFTDGSKIPFGVAVYVDEPGYLNTPDQEESFKNEIVKLPKFYLSGYNYDADYSLYINATRLANEGLIFIFNNKDVSTNPDEFLIYAPTDPTHEQILALQEFNNKYKDSKKEVAEIINGIDNYKEYDSINSYINSKSHSSNLTSLR